MRTDEMHVWLWSAGNFCEVSDDQGRTMQYAQTHLSADGMVLAESAWLTLGVYGPRHIRTGHRFTAHLVRGRARWIEVMEAEAS